MPEKSIGASFNDEPLSRFGFWADWTVEPQWNLCNAPGADNGGKVNCGRGVPRSDDKVLVCTHATFRFAVDRFGVEAFDDRLIAVDEFHHVSATPTTSWRISASIHRARQGACCRNDRLLLSRRRRGGVGPGGRGEVRDVTYTYYEQLNGYEYLKQLDIGYFFYSGSYADDILKVLDPAEKTIMHIPNVNRARARRTRTRKSSTSSRHLGEWQGTDAATGFQLVKTPDGRVLRIADLVDDDAAKREQVSAALKDPAQKNNRDHVDIIIALGMAKEGFDWIWCEHALTVGYRSA